jgi:hypothetical protein
LAGTNVCPPAVPEPTMIRPSRFVSATQPAPAAVRSAAFLNPTMAPDGTTAAAASAVAVAKNEVSWVSSVSASSPEPDPMNPVWNSRRQVEPAPAMTERDQIWSALVNCTVSCQR